MNAKTKNILVWLITILLALSFTGAAIFKLTATNDMVESFNKWGLPIWLMYTIGVLEVLGAIGLLLKKFRIQAATCLALLMLGAMVIHAINSEWIQMLPPAVHAMLTAIVLRIRKSQA